MKTLRPIPVLRAYQEDGITEIRTAYSRRIRRALYALSTGGGKTVIFAYIAWCAVQKGSRVIILAHRKELITQISKALDTMGVQHGLIMAGHTMTADRVQVGMVNTVANRVEKGAIDECDLLIIDEAHHGVTGSYRRITDAWTRTKVLGVTATPQRLDGKGLGQCFDVLIQGPSMRSLIDAGYLADYVYLAPPSSLDLSGVRTRGGDYAVDDLEKAMAASTIVGDAVVHYCKFLNGKPAIAFCVTLSHCRQVQQQFEEAGWKAAVIDGSMSTAERADLIASLADGRLNVLISCELINEGVDVPVVSGVILLRPTKSLTVYLQQIGRSLRLKPDGSAAIILDHVGNVHLHGMPDMEREWSLDGKKKRDKAPDVTTCHLCFKTFDPGTTRQLTANCAGSGGEICPYQDDSESQKMPPMVVEGELQVVTDVVPCDPMRPAWAKGISIDKGETKGRNWYRLLDLADTEDKLREIAKARGYKRGWVQHKLREKEETKRGVSAILDGYSDCYMDPDSWEEMSDSVIWSVIRTVDAAIASHEDFPDFWKDMKNFARLEIEQRRESRAA